MSKRTSHRGPNPRDAEDFKPDNLPILRKACEDYSLLLSKIYSEKAALKLVGDHYQLTKRQRMAVYRFSCSDQHLKSLLAKLLPNNMLKQKEIFLDAFNIIITIEAALSGGFIIASRDHCCRDLSEVYSNYKIIEETPKALMNIGKSLDAFEVSKVNWLIDKPVSNSGRLAELISQTAKENSWNWTTELIFSPDKKLKEVKGPIATSDRAILDHCHNWLNLNSFIIKKFIHSARLLDLTP